MAPRASWKGYLDLVSCPIALYPAASSSERVSFNRINKKTGNRLKQQLIDAETGEKEDIGRGYEIGKGQYFQVEDEEIEKIRIESSHTIPSKPSSRDRDRRSLPAASTKARAHTAGKTAKRKTGR